MAEESSTINARLNVNILRIEYLENPQSIDALKPRFSWTLQGDGRGRYQTAYQIVVASDPGKRRYRLGLENTVLLRRLVRNLRQELFG